MIDTKLMKIVIVSFYRILFSSRIKMDQCKQIDFEYDIGMFTKNLATEELLCLQL